VSNTALFDQIVARLALGPFTGTALRDALGVSQSSISRALRQLSSAGQVLKVGTRRDARYALRRPISTIGSEWPLRRVTPAGTIQELGTLFSIAADQFYLDVRPEAIGAGFAYRGFTKGIPHWLQDQRPGGFLGRAIPGRYPDLQLPERVIDWTDNQYLRYLTQHGSDCVSDLILGNEAFNEYLASLRHPQLIPTDQRATRYPELAREVMAGGLPGSSAHGDHPKFTALITTPAGERAVLVKFSPPRKTAIGQRWSDLLVAEHQAHEVLRAAGIPACESTVHHFEDRTYLELIRFDRRGLLGRMGVSSLLAIDTGLYGNLDNWIAAANRLARDGRISVRTLEQIRLAETFGILIANTDRHFGNIALLETYTGRYELAPIYDMLPMLFAPGHDQIVARVFSPPDPTSETLSAWPHARELAESYWRDLSRTEQVSAEFRSLCAECLRTLESFPRIGAYAAAAARLA
jgi:DNA-binding transcriptional ArsR family regulator